MARSKMKADDRKNIQLKTTNSEIISLWDAMTWFRGTQSEAARHLGINRGSLRGYLESGLAHDMYLFVVRNGDGHIIGFDMINPRYPNKKD